MLKTTYNNADYQYPRHNIKAGINSGLREPLNVGDICFSVYWGDDTHYRSIRYLIVEKHSSATLGKCELTLRRLDNEIIFSGINGAYCFPVIEISEDGKCPLCGGHAKIYEGGFDCDEGC